MTFKWEGAAHNVVMVESKDDYDNCFVPENMREAEEDRGGITFKARQEVDFQLSDNDMWVLRERIAARKTRSEAPWRRLTAWTAAWLGCCRRVGRCFGQSL